MLSPPPLCRVPVVALAGLLAAGAAGAEGRAMRADGTAPDRCLTRTAAPGATGVAQRQWTAPATGLARVRLAGGAAPDWDLAVFDARGRRRGASAGFGSDETAVARVRRGQRLLVQACRRSGPRRVAWRARVAALRRTGGPAALVRVRLEGAGDLARLHRRGLDVTHQTGPGHADVVLYGERDRRRLHATGLGARTLVADLAARARSDAAADRRRARAAGASGLPSGRWSYREPVDYQADLKGIVERHPQLARPVVLAPASVEGRRLEGIELAADVHRSDDGRPSLVVMGLQHAREWPGGEVTAELALDLAARAAADPRIAGLLERLRVVLLPVANPDGFARSRAAGFDPSVDDHASATEAAALADHGAYKRKNARGVDLNRNAGAYWGGGDASTDRTAQTYRGPAPWSEPESRAVRRLLAERQVTVFVSNHTYLEAGGFLRQPGFTALGRLSPDERALALLGDGMGRATGYESIPGWQIGEITGAADDWAYHATGAYAYTPELRGTNFHGRYADAVVGEYVGEGGRPGLREAFLLAAEVAADPAHHALITGTAPPGARLRLHRTFVTPTSRVVDDDGDRAPDRPLLRTEAVASTLAVGASGRFRWHVGPSSRPLALRPEAWTLSCRTPGGAVLERRLLRVRRGGRTAVDLGCAGAPTTAPAAPRLNVPVPSLRPGRGVRLLSSRRLPSARRIAARGRVVVRLSARPALRSVRVRLEGPGGVVASARLRRLAGARPVSLPLLRTPVPGRHRLTVRGLTRSAPVRETRTLVVPG